MAVGPAIADVNVHVESLVYLPITSLITRRKNAIAIFCGVVLRAAAFSRWSSNFHAMF